MKSVLVLILAVVSINAFAWSHTGSSVPRNTDHAYNGHRRF
jgi:hypothetical protein